MTRIARMLEDSFGSADDDMRARAIREQQVEAQRLSKRRWQRLP